MTTPTETAGDERTTASESPVVRFREVGKVYDDEGLRVTAISPLQYQKQLRRQDARQLMLEDPIHDGANDSVIDERRDLGQLAAVRSHEKKRVVCLAALCFALFRECTPIRPSAGRA